MALIAELRQNTFLGTIRGKKGFPVAAGTHVPLIAYWPGTIAPGKENDALIDFTDFLPTLLEAAGRMISEDLTADGLSFYGQLTGRADTARNWIYGHYDPRWGSFVPSRYVQDHDWKLYADGSFFNWSHDLDEQSPLADSTLDDTKRHVRDRLQEILDAMSPVTR